jgi:hypothetical protein
MKKRPTTQREQMLRRYKFAKASFAIEGLHLSPEMAAAFELCIQLECDVEQMTAMLQHTLPAHVTTVRG